MAKRTWAGLGACWFGCIGGVLGAGLSGCSTTPGGFQAQNPKPAILAPAREGMEAQEGAPVALPGRLEGGRFVVTPVTEDGQTVRLYTDTGGGLFLKRAAARKLKLLVEPIEGEGGETIDGAFLPVWAWDAWIPPIEVNDGRIPILAEPPTWFSEDGMLGQAWFARRTWTFDYVEGVLYLRKDGDVPKRARQIPVGFRQTPDGVRETNFPRIEAEIAGASESLLFDTGARVRLSPEAAQAIGDGGPVVRAASFIAKSTLDRWAAAHADWRVLERADAENGARMIEVPSVRLAGIEVGPVWFTERADQDMLEWMSQWTDRPIVGALGGNAYRGLSLTLDYPSAKLYITVPEKGPRPAGE